MTNLNIENKPIDYYFFGYDENSIEQSLGPVYFNTLNYTMTEHQDYLLNQLINNSYKTLRDNNILISNSDDGIEFEFPAEALFDSGNADLNENAKYFLLKFIDLFKNNKNPIKIEGFTDNKPINSEKFPSNWELSSARAISVAKFMIANDVNPKLLSVTGYAEHHPIESNETERGRSRNRRVIIYIEKKPNNRVLSNPIKRLDITSYNIKDNYVLNHNQFDKYNKPKMFVIDLKNHEILITSDPRNRELINKEADIYK